MKDPLIIPYVRIQQELLSDLIALEKAVDWLRALYFFLLQLVDVRTYYE
jgi:hypothetical protein